MRGKFPFLCPENGRSSFSVLLILEVGERRSLGVAEDPLQIGHCFASGATMNCA